MHADVIHAMMHNMHTCARAGAHVYIQIHVCVWGREGEELTTQETIMFSQHTHK